MCLFQVYIDHLHVLYNAMFGTLTIVISTIAGLMYHHYQNNHPQQQIQQQQHEEW